MKTLEFGLKTDDESKSSLTSTNEERAAKKSVYAGIGNWIYHGNPYKRWMTIEDEERKLLQSPDSTNTDVTDFHSKYSAEKSRHTREDRPRGREYVDRSPRRHERFRSHRYGHHFDDSSRHERSHSDRHKRDLFDDRSKRDEQIHFSRSEHRYHEERRRSDFTSRQASASGAEIPKREKSSRRSPSRDHKRHKYDEDFERMSNKSSKSYVKRESRASSKSREGEPTENLVSSVDSRLNQSLSKFDHKNEVTVLLDDTTKHGDEAKLSIGDRRSSSSCDMERKHHKKKKKHKKKSKKQKKQRSSSQSS